MQLLREFGTFISDHHLFSKNDRLLLAVSGGIDSIVLCELCRLSGFDFRIAHGNFQLRGQESERDERFVRALQDKYACDVLVKRFDTKKFSAENKMSTQLAARSLRYAWFDELLQSGEGQWLLTAHHLDDNIETLLMHFFRGTGIAGLRAMQPKQGKIIRPLLFVRKEELQSFASAHGLSWVEDSSNATDDYSRNYFRHEVIPALQRIYPQVLGNLADNIDRFREVEMLYRQSILSHKKNLLRQNGEDIHIAVLKLKKAEPLHTITYEIMRDFGFSAQQVPEVLALLDAGSGKYISSATHRVLRNRNWLIISPLRASSPGMILIEGHEKKLAFGNQVLWIERQEVSDAYRSSPIQTAFFDAALISFPLLLRKWHNGDYFYPLGLRKKKKLARFFIDRKLSRADKEKTWVLEMDKKIVWIVGLRIDDRFKVTANTKEVWKITVSNP